ncbi:hypothetical protein J0H58_02555 [bacterium]|nr:hypothetical protein [bacterium]
MTRYRTAAAGWLIAAALAGGCGAGEKQTGTVTGTVAHNGAPVHTGTLNLISKTGAASMAKINDTGAFKLDAPLEAGEYKAYVSPPIPEPQPPGSKAAAPKKFEVPPKFQDPSTSGATVVVKAGANDVKVDFR